MSRRRKRALVVPRTPRRRWKKVFAFVFLLSAAVLLAIPLHHEMRTSRWQAAFFARQARKLDFRMEPGQGSAVRFPKTGPHDERLGYVSLPVFQGRLVARDFEVKAQVRQSPELLSLLDHGMFAPYREKTQAGLRIVDRHGEPVFFNTFPERVYDDFASIPEVIVKSLVHIENRELLDPRLPYLNPAVEWDRLGAAVFNLVLRFAGSEREVPGGSTLATQLEKYRHSPQGLTGSIGEKYRQMVSAALRGYMEGEETMGRRRQIVLDYINSIPLGAFPGYGEVIGLGDGLYTWYDKNFESINSSLFNRAAGRDDPGLAGWARDFKEVLSLFIAQRRPTYYLLEDSKALASRTDSFLRFLADSNIITSWERDAAVAAPLEINRRRPPLPETSFLERKTANVSRPRLLSLLGVSRIYELDRLDLHVQSSLDYTVQEEVTKALRALGNPDFAKQAGIRGPFLLGDQDPSKVIYSFTLYERAKGANLLRVQTDNLDQPLNINEGMKLELGSSAKLRTLASYLEIIAILHATYAHLDRAELMNISSPELDRLSRWSINYLITAEDKSLTTMLKAAMERPYSASPAETFFTGGGQHTFVNFDKKHNNSILSVREALNHSVNLVFIRMMRDIVSYYTHKRPDVNKLLKDASDPRREAYLVRFADKEGSVFMHRFFKKYQGKGPSESLEILLQGARPTPVGMTVIYRYVKPEAGLNEFTGFLRTRLPNSTLTEKTIQKLYKDYGPDTFSLQDRGYLARVHPLELWTVNYLRNHPEAGWNEFIDAGAEERQLVYAWLFKTHRKNKQDIRIRTLLEVEAFSDIHGAWKRMGYPFDSLVPSYATAIGSSADRPAALAELVGIILNDGIRHPLLRFEEFHFAEGTPFETVIKRREGKGVRVMEPEVAFVLREALAGVVEKGTAQRVNKAFVRNEGEVLPVGGKTGTGDNRRDVYGSGGRLLHSKVINRTAVFVFYIGDRFFGTITAFVDGAKAAEYSFTSGLPTQVLKVLAPTIMALDARPQAEYGFDENAGAFREEEDLMLSARD